MRFDHTDADRVMIDIETLGTEPGDAILSIGAVYFDLDGVGDTFYRSILVESCQAADLRIDAETLEWWLGQDDAAQDVLAGGEGLPTALVEFTEWLRAQDFDEIWANSPSFDCEMLEVAYDAIGTEAPWEYYQERDFRTLKSLPGAAEIEQDGTEHHALEDAVHQARVASATLRMLEEADD
jgi:hypothetical protein